MSWTAVCRRLKLPSVLAWRRLAPTLQCVRASPYSTEKEIDEGLRLGDYTVLPRRSAQQERPFGWWDNQDRRDKETPLHEEDDALNMWMFDAVENNGKYTRWQALGQLMTMFALLGGVYYLSVLYDAPSRNPAVPRQFPFDNLYVERGGDPAVPPTQRGTAGKVKATYGETF